jgi:hypothetical protein
MTTIGEWLNPTRAVGLIAYGTAVTCCGIAWVRLKNQRRDWGLAALLMLVEGTLLLDIAFNWRWMLHQCLAVSGSLLSVVVWCVEVVSLHAVDHILYHLIGKWMVVSALWILACSMTSIGILLFGIALKPRLG